MAYWCWTVLATSSVLLVGCAEKHALPTYGAVPAFTLTDQTGAAFSSATALQNRVWVADFIFTNCPGPCPRMSSQMHEVQTALSANDDARFVSFTVDPARDTPLVLATYAGHFQAAPGKWFFLTGPVPSLENLSRNVFKLGDVDGSLQHSTRFALVDRSSQIRGFYLSSEPDAIPTLIADAKRLLAERL